MKKTVVFGFLGVKLDAMGGFNLQKRMGRWRPTVGLCSQPDFPVHRLELLHNPRDKALAGRIVDDIGAISPATGVRPFELALTNPWDFEEVYTKLRDFSLGYEFDIDREDYFVHITTGTHVVQICCFLLTEAHHFPGRLIQTMPRRNREEEEEAGGRPAGFVDVIDLDLSRYDQIAQRFRREQADAISHLKSGITTKNAAFNVMIEQIERVAGRSRAPMLLTGPTGAGKSFLARRVFELKQARQKLKGRFVEVNCATLRGDSAMSALFGHVKGAFTGALSERAGLLRQADGGVLFLDEIGELGMDEQAMLLKAIEDKRFPPFGSDSETESDFQLIAGTNRDLRERIREGRFRADLYARINLWTFRLPALAERPEDIEPNLDYELARYARDCGVQARFNVEARRRYLAFACAPETRWPGNFRELTASVTRLATLATNGRITEADVAEEIGRLRAAWNDTWQSPDSVESALGKEAAAELDLFERGQLEVVLQTCQRSRSLSEAGRLLFAHSRQQKKQANDADRLRKYLLRFGLDWETAREMEKSLPDAVG
ncbi:MAG: RNA repair transcriptional activator RtcR [Betaproteobacteria bacterium]|nr:RNA repair transcriptional activator RtcR [Betaproteobacteria bacterium]MCL2885258.1 RNA repair transcriptional activator RtcR [Betaproteobacteria bacterium]